MIRWEVLFVNVQLYDPDVARLEELLDAGWEPFSAYSKSLYDCVALRRPRPESGEEIERAVDRALGESR